VAQIAFIGLGTMGLPMARNLLGGGHTVSGFDLDADAVAEHAKNWGLAARSAADAARGAEFIITMLPNAGNVRAALFDGDGILESMNPQALFIDMSTIHPQETDTIRNSLREKGFAMVDAPVGRTSLHAREGKLLIMAGGAQDDLERARPLFELLGDAIVDCGGPGTGSRMKIVNNFMSTVLNVLTAEALTLAEASGLEVALAMRVMAGTAAGQGHMATTYPAKVLKGDLEPAFMLDLAHKDLGLALDLAAGAKVPVPLGAAAREVYSLARSRGRGSQDWTAIYELAKELAGLPD
jgi:4-hydroxybutyrate dehydrogenase/sulfolactaldehyde 3-reductase